MVSEARAGRERERGDFQTPPALAARCCEVLLRLERGLRPALVVEPTCGRGAFVVAAARAFPDARVIGVDLDRAHLAAARRAVDAAGIGPGRVTLREADVFALDWAELLGPARGQPLLVLGNPPWVTNAEIGRLGGSNLPRKQNLKGLRGYDAKTGASNFDVSEWLLLTLLERLQGVEATVAMLCKLAVARKVVEHAARRDLALECDGLWRFDAGAAFGASVEAGFLVFTTAARRAGGRTVSCPVGELDAAGGARPAGTAGAFGIFEGTLVADLEAAARWRELRGEDGLRWRSGLKHDCARVMELHHLGGDRYRNGLGEEVRLEAEHVYPLLKGTDLQRGQVAETTRRVVVTQRRPGDDTAAIAREAPATWAYLERHRARLDARASSIYAGRPPFSIFGIGPYAFAPHKVAVSGLHKEPRFSLLGPIDGRPVMLDDTCAFLAFEAADVAAAARDLLETEPARALLRALLFADAKRPVTVRLLEELHLGRLAAWAAPSWPEAGQSALARLRALAG